ncbi:MAG TPA: HEAT repeat domain-containing protein [Geobacteraceae bacterium]
MPTPNADVPPAVRGLQGKTVEELLLLVGDEDLGFKPEAVELLLHMGLEANYPVFEQAVRNDDNADLRNGAMEVLVKFGKRAVPKLVRLLRDANEEVRNFSAVMIGDIGSRDAVGPLIQALGDPDANVSHSVAEALGKIGDRAALMPLMDLLKGEFWLQYAAITAIGAMRDYRAVPQLLQLLDNELLAGPVIEALGKIGDPRSLYPLGNTLASGDDALVGTVAKAMVAIYHHLYETLSYKNSLVEYTQPEQLKKIIASRGVEKLRALLRDDGDRESVEAAITLLGWLGDATALGDFFRLLANDGYMKTVESAILAIGRPAEKALLAALTADSDNVKIIALHSLRWLGVACDPAVLTGLLTLPNQAVQLEALESLKAFPSDALLPRLFAFLEQGSDEVSRRAAEVIGRFPTDQAQGFLREASRASSVRTRLRAAMLLGHLKEGGAPHVIACLFHDEDVGVRREVVKAIGLQQVRDAVPLLKEVLSDPDDHVREAAVIALAEFGEPVLLQELLALLGSGKEPLDYAVIRAIGKMRARDAGVSLVEHLASGRVSRQVEYAIVETLGKISYKPASELISRHYLQHADPDFRRLAVEALGNLGDQDSLNGVEASARDPHWSVRIAALHVLGNLGGVRELPILVAAMTDPDHMVRKHAIITLGNLRNATTVPELVKQLTDMEMSKYAFEALLGFGRSALPWLHRLMKKDYPLEVRERVIDLIGKVGDHKSVEPLMELLEDPSPVIRLAAIDSLAYCFDSVLLKKLVHVRKSDGHDEVRNRAELALKTFTMEKYF